MRIATVTVIGLESVHVSTYRTYSGVACMEPEQVPPPRLPTTTYVICTDPMNGEELRIVRSMRSEHCPRFIVLLIGYKGHKLGVSTSLDGVISSSGKGFLFRKGGGGQNCPSH